MSSSSDEDKHLHKALDIICDVPSLIRMIMCIPSSFFQRELQKCEDHIRLRAERRNVDPADYERSIPQSQVELKDLLARMPSRSGMLDMVRRLVARHRAKFHIPESKTVLHVWMFMFFTEYIYPALSKDPPSGDRDGQIQSKIAEPPPDDLSAYRPPDRGALMSSVKAQSGVLSDNEESDVEYEDERRDKSRPLAVNPDEIVQGRNKNIAPIRKPSRYNSGGNTNYPLSPEEHRRPQTTTNSSFGRPYTPGPPPPPPPPPPKLGQSSSQPNVQQPQRRPTVVRSPTETTFTRYSDPGRVQVKRSNSEPMKRRGSTKKGGGGGGGGGGNSTAAFLAKWIF